MVLAKAVGDATGYGTGQIVCIVKDCSVKTTAAPIGAPANMQGDMTKGNTVVNGGDMGSFAFQNGGGWSFTATEESMTRAIQRFGFNHTFICSGMSSQYRECFFFDATLPKDGDAYGYIRTDDGFQTAPTFGFCSGYYRGNNCTGGVGDRWGVGGVKYASSTKVAVLLVGRELGSISDAVPKIGERTFAPVENAPLFTAPYTGQIPAEAAQKELDPALIAAIANAAWKALSESGQKEEGVMPYDATAPVTPQVVQATQAQAAQNGVMPPRLGNLLAAPMLRNGQTVIQGGTMANPTKGPQEVINVGDQEGNSNNGGSQNSKNEYENQKDKDWDEPDDETTAYGDIFQPWRDWMEGPFKRYLHPSIVIPQGRCPTPTVDFEGWFSGLTGASSNPRELHDFCDAVEPYQPMAATMAHFFAFMASFFILMTGGAWGRRGD